MTTIVELVIKRTSSLQPQRQRWWDTSKFELAQASDPLQRSVFKSCRRRCAFLAIILGSIAILCDIVILNGIDYVKLFQEGGDHDVKLHLVHVLCPFVDSSAPGEFLPLDRNQWVAMQSIKRALRNIPSGSFQVELVCAVFTSDLEALAEARLPCHRFAVLSRSTRTQYPQLGLDTQLPFIADLIDAATANATHVTLNSRFHVMITNADIGLSKNFYTHVYSVMQRFDAFSINRVTIPIQHLQITTNSTDMLENQIDSWILHGSKHPGYDLFCIRSSVLERVSFGQLFLGRPPWGSNIHLMLRIMADHYTNIESNARGTFHLGNDKSRWQGNISTEWRRTSIPTSPLWRYCPSKAQLGSDALTIQNHANCGRWFLGNVSISSIRTNDSSVFIPGFVRPGYEALFLQRYSEYLLYDAEGLPQTKDFQTPTKKTKARGVFRNTVSVRERGRRKARGDSSPTIRIM